MKRALIIVNGEVNDYDFYKNYIREDDFIVCADGGIKHLNAIGKTPDIFVGDFDSCNANELCEGIEIYKHNPKKTPRSPACSGETGVGSFGKDLRIVGGRICQREG